MKPKLHSLFLMAGIAAASTQTGVPAGKSESEVFNEPDPPTRRAMFAQPLKLSKKAKAKLKNKKP